MILEVQQIVTTSDTYSSLWTRSAMPISGYRAPQALNDHTPIQFKDVLISLFYNIRLDLIVIQVPP